MSDTKDCLNCPAYLSAEEASSFFGTVTNLPMCSRYGKVLGTPAMSESQQRIVTRGIAENCDDFGRKNVVKPPELAEGNVFLPVNRAILEDEPEPDDLESTGSCRNCVFYIEPSEVNREHGINQGACSRNGRTIMPEKVVREAELCNDKLWRYNDDRVVETYRASELLLGPLYQMALDHDDSPLGQWKARRKSGVSDPGDWPTDKPVSADDADNGIKAWREVTDPMGSGNSVLIPVFDLEFFDDAEQRKVPMTGDDEAPEDYIDSQDYVYSALVEMMLLNETPALWGPPGVGKTELARHLAWMMQVPFDRISITNSTEVEYVAGMTFFEEGETRFKPGRIPQRWTLPGVIVIDEPNAGPPDVWQFIRPLTDNSKQLVLDMSGNNEVIDRHPHAYMLMAMNPTWDFRNTGLNEVADADTNRLSHIFMDYPDRKVEAQILENACKRAGWTPNKGTIDKVLDASEDIRKMSEDGTLPVTWGVRSNLKAIRHMQYFNPQVAYRRAVTDYLEPDIAQMVLKVVEMKGLS